MRIGFQIESQETPLVQHEDARTRARLAVEMRRGKPADASAHDDEVVVLAGVACGGCRAPERAVPERVEGFEGPGVRPAKAGERGGVRRVLGQRLVETGRKRAGDERAADADGDTVQEVAARNGTIDAEVAIQSSHGEGGLYANVGVAPAGHRFPIATSFVSRYSASPSLPLS